MGWSPRCYIPSFVEIGPPVSEKKIFVVFLPYGPRRQKTGLRGFRLGPTKTGLCSHRRCLEAWKFGFRKKRKCTIKVAKTKALISFAVTAKLICVFVFAYAKIRFSHVAAHIRAWWPPWSCDQHHVHGFSFPHTSKLTYKIWLKMVQWFLRNGVFIFICTCSGTKVQKWHWPWMLT